MELFTETTGEELSCVQSHFRAWGGSLRKVSPEETGCRASTGHPAVSQGTQPCREALEPRAALFWMPGVAVCLTVGVCCH